MDFETDYEEREWEAYIARKDREFEFLMDAIEGEL